MINNELLRYDETLAEKPQLVVLTKIDIPEVRDKAEELSGHFEALGYPVLAISAVTKEGLKELVTRVGRELDRLRGHIDDDEF
jgi:GTP-binding protein